jgi:hypothetical protein
VTGRPATNARDESGVTLIELAITTMLLGIVLAMVVGVMVSVQSSVEIEAGRSTRNDRLALAIRVLERQVRSGEVVGDPATENDATHGIFPGMSVRILRQPATVGGVPRCSQWRIDDERLEFREWSPNWAVDGDWTDWILASKGISNRLASPSITAFALSSEPAYAGRVLEVELAARGDATEGTLQHVETSLTGRNAVVGSPSSTCNSIPPY